MARWRPGAEPARIEPPEWYRVFDPASWDEPDGTEQRFIDGNLGWPWPDELHVEHARRRWFEAQQKYRRAHPAFGTQEFRDCIDRYRHGS